MTVNEPVLGVPVNLVGFGLLSPGERTYVPAIVEGSLEVNDILIDNRSDPSIWDQLRHVRRKYRRDNPVVHIKFLDNVVTYPLKILVNNQGVSYNCIERNGKRQDSASNEILLFDSGLPNFRTIHIVRVGNQEKWRISMYTDYSFSRHQDVANSVDMRTITFFYWRADFLDQYAWDHIPSWDEALQLVNTVPGDYLSERHDILNYGDGAVVRGGSNPEWTDVIRFYQADALLALEHNDLELVKNSSKTEFHAEVPYDVQFGLGQAWSHAIEPRENNEGILAVGFNNLQNLLEVKDLVSNLLFESAEQVIRHADEAVDFWKYSKSYLNRGNSLFDLTTDPRWEELTPRQQRALVRRAQRRKLDSKTNWRKAITSGVPTDALSVTGDAWFQARYNWSTGLSDFEEAYRYFYVQMQKCLGTMEQYPILHGKFVSDNITYRTSFRVRERALEGLAAAEAWAYKYGMQLTPAVLWDFVPFSFVVDWFFPVSATLEQFSKEEYYSPQYYEYFDGVCNSMKYQTKTPRGIDVQVYTRWYEPAPHLPDLGFYWINGGSSPSDLTASFRTVDGIFLLFRR